MSSEQKKCVALQVVSKQKSISSLADENNTSRKFIRKQGIKLQEVVDKQFVDTYKSNDDDVIYYLPITKAWISQFVIALMLLTNASYRNIIMLLKDVFDYNISIGSVNSIFKETVEQARKNNAAEDLSNIDVTANDELYHLNKPILSGIDVSSLYCYLLSEEDKRDEVTWAIHLMDAEEKGLNPQRTIGDDAKGLVSGHKIVFPETPYDYDNFHLSKSLMELRRLFRNRLKTSITVLNTLQQQYIKSSDDDRDLLEDISIATENEKKIRDVSNTLDTLISWLEHDVLNKAGPTLEERYDLYDFIVIEFKKLEVIGSPRLRAMRITLENKKEAALHFATVLDEEFKQLSHQLKLPVDLMWEICKLQRCDANNNAYYIRSMSLRRVLKNRFSEIEKQVIDIMDKTERTSSMIENLNGRVRKCIRNRIEIGHGYLDLLRFYMNHKPFVRSARTERKGRTPAEILSGKPHPHWLDLLGFKRFKRTA